MPVFEYMKIDDRGKQTRQQIVAQSFDAALQDLTIRGVWFTNLTQKVSKKIKKMNLRQKILFFEDLHQLLRAKISLFEAVELIESKVHKEPFYVAICGIKEMLGKGKSFAAALDDADCGFDPLIVGMIRTAESSGDIEGVVGEIVLLLKKEEWLKKQIISGISYPLFLLVLAFVVLFILLCFLVPSLKDLFTSAHLPLITRVIISVSDFVSSHIWSMLTFFGLSCLGFFSLLRRKEVQLFLGRFVLSIPYLSNFLKEYYMARFVRTLYALVLANIPFVEALKITRNVMHNPVFREGLEKIIVAMEQGKSMHLAFSESQMIPKMFSRMVDTAEKSGQLKAILAQASSLYETTVDESLKKFLAVLQPFLIIIIGLIVGLIMIGTLLPMTDIRSFMEVA